MGFDRLYAGARDGHSADRLGCRSLRNQTSLPRIDCLICHRLSSLRNGMVGGFVNSVPGCAGLRWRHDPARGHNNPDPCRWTSADRPCDGHHGCADAAGPYPRPHTRRLSCRRSVMALDFLRKPSCRGSRHHRCRSQPRSRHA